MKICHICSNYDKFYENLMEKQISYGLDLRVFYFRAKERGLPDVNASYVDVRLNYSNWQRPLFYWKERSVLNDFFEIYKGQQFDLIHAHTLFSNGYIALQAKKKWGTPYIVAVRDMDINVFLKYRINLRKLGVEILSQAEKIIFLSKSYRDQTLMTYVPKSLREEFYNKSDIIPNGVDNYYLENKSTRDVRDKTKTLNILTVGFVSKRKNQLTVCEAVKRLNDIGIVSDYTIVGGVIDRKILKRLKEYSFVKYIPFLSKEELIQVYRRSDIFVMPSLTETFGLTYVEAMTQGLPIIYSKEQGFDGQFDEGIVGFHVTSTNANEIVDVTKKIVRNYNEISENSSKLCDLFNWSEITEKYKMIYMSILKRSDL